MDYTILKMFKIHNDKVKELIGIDYAKATYQRFMTTKLHVEDFLKTKTYKVCNVQPGFFSSL
jgi:hypothetical protein